MNKILFNLLLVIFLCCSVDSFGQTNGKIPITSKSDKAAKLYKKGFELDNKLEKDQAEIAYQEALKLDSSFVSAYLGLAMLRDNFDVRKKYLAEAMKHIDSVSEGERLWLLARNAFYGTGKDKDEYESFEKLVKLYPNDEKANYFFGFVNYQHGKKDFQKAIYHLRKAIEINPNFIAPYNDIAYPYMEIGNFKNAELFIKKYIELLPNSANPYDTYAEMLMRSGQYEKSITMYDKVLTINPQYAWAIIGKAANLNFINRHSEARKVLEKLDSIKLSDFEDRHKWVGRMVSFVDEGKFNEAIALLEEQHKQATLRNDYHQQYFSLLRAIRLHFETNNPSEGLRVYERWNALVQAKSTSDTSKKAALNLNWYYKAYDAYLDNKFDSAKQLLSEFEKAAGSPNDEASVLRALILIKEKDYSSALEILKKTDLTNPYNQFRLAETYKLSGDKAAAKQWFEKAASKNVLNNLDFALVRKRAKAS